MSKDEKKLAKKQAKIEKKEAKAEKAIAKANANAEKKHAKAYEKFVKETEKKNAKLQAKKGNDFVPIAIPAVEEFATKKEIKAAAAAKKAYAKYVKKIENKNAKAEKKCAKKGKPFVPIAVPNEEEFMNSASSENKVGKIILMVILILLIWFLIYFMYMYIHYEYVAPVEETTVSEQAAPGVYESYSNPHEMTTTPDYSIADAKLLLKQTLHDNWGNIGYKSDPSSGAISYNNRIEEINSADCYMFTCGGKTFAVSVKLSAVYYCHNGEYTPLSFNNTEILFN